MATGTREATGPKHLGDTRRPSGRSGGGSARAGGSGGSGRSGGAGRGSGSRRGAGFGKGGGFGRGGGRSRPAGSARRGSAPRRGAAGRRESRLGTLVGGLIRRPFGVLGRSPAEGWGIVACVAGLLAGLGTYADLTGPVGRGLRTGAGYALGGAGRRSPSPWWRSEPRSSSVPSAARRPASDPARPRRSGRRREGRSPPAPS